MLWQSSLDSSSCRQQGTSWDRRIEFCVLWTPPLPPFPSSFQVSDTCWLYRVLLCTSNGGCCHLYLISKVTAVCRQRTQCNFLHELFWAATDSLKTSILSCIRLLQQRFKLTKLCTLHLFSSQWDSVCPFKETQVCVCVRLCTLCDSISNNNKKINNQPNTLTSMVSCLHVPNVQPCLSGQNVRSKYVA